MCICSPCSHIPLPSCNISVHLKFARSIWSIPNMSQIQSYTLFWIEWVNYVITRYLVLLLQDEHCMCGIAGYSNSPLYVCCEGLEHFGIWMYLYLLIFHLSRIQLAQMPADAWLGAGSAANSEHSFLLQLCQNMQLVLSLHVWSEHI